MNVADYSRIEKAIVFLDRNYQEQPSLDEVAKAAGLSPFHFQRLFRRWAGISPKRFLQFLTAEHARALLEQSRPLLEAAFEAGLSGTGRLHDLMVSIHAATPGEIKSRGEGMHIAYGTHATRFGECLVATTARGVCWLSFDEHEEALGELQKRWPKARLVATQSQTRALVERIFAADKPVDLHLRGTNFQIRVWEALLRIPVGHVTTYEEVAEQVCTARATRAVASAVGANPVSWVIPCHRVIRKTGALGGYRWGLPRKQAMLAWESAAAL
ncbi:MAG: methylated-DNA--[protein]-cysteine S-methyltransferase [Acidimicrobiia bacterium]|nr:methylated-DNA--[protein]-cysteine S-methyltransferase [Acidimicrobiia bacterium]